MTIQSILFPKKRYSVKEAKQYLKDHGYKTNYNGKKYDETEHYYRFRQAKPLSKKKQKEGWRYTVRVVKGGVKYIIMFLL